MKSKTDKKNKYTKVRCPKCGEEREVRIIMGVPQGGLCKKCMREIW